MSSAESHSPGNVPGSRIERLVESASHYLPSQGPITVFVHHNTLHAFEYLPFEKGVVEGGELYGCRPFLTEESYRSKLSRGRIHLHHLRTEIEDDLGADALLSLNGFGTRLDVRLGILKAALQVGSEHELQWFITGTDALKRFLPEVDAGCRENLLEETKRWTMRDLRPALLRGKQELGRLQEELQNFDLTDVEQWESSRWEALTLHLLWSVISNRTNRSMSGSIPLEETPSLLHRDYLLAESGEDSHLIVHDCLIRFWSVFLDQGFTNWELPDREQGAFGVFLRLSGTAWLAPTRFSQAVAKEARRLRDAGVTSVQSVEESLRLLGVGEEEQEKFILHTLLALRGWAGMVWQMETNAPWEPHPAPRGSLVDFLAIRLVLERVALEQLARDAGCYRGSLAGLRKGSPCQDSADVQSRRMQTAFTLFQLSQFQGWSPQMLSAATDEDFLALVREIERFTSLERRRLYHLAFERKYRHETLDALLQHGRRLKAWGKGSQHEPAAYQIVCCIDEREESFRRHLEEVDPCCETFGIAGFFGVAMFYRGVEEAHFRPLCPVNIDPDHYVVEEPLFSEQQVEERRAETRRRIGHVTHHAHRGTRSALFGFLSGLVGTLAVFPLVARILFPRTTARVRRFFGRMVKSPATELHLERTLESPSAEGEGVGYSIQEMAAIVEGGLRAIGLTKENDFSRLVVVCGHGSASLNNPQEAAHDCGACGGGRGGPNARAFCHMANDRGVRHVLEERGFPLPEETVFVGAYHNTCDDNVEWYDLDEIPRSHRALFKSVRDVVDEARMRSAHERCRRFESADLDLTPEEALRHVEGRAEDLSQPRPEYGHCTNALCFVGRREWSRGLFLDRRAFLTSYDSRSDDEQSSILTKLLSAVIPVCAGINLEYYFSFVDPTGYGCGTKLPHNITSLIGVMDGAASDLRPGLPWQMTELHEPVRLLFVIETTTEALTRIIEGNEGIARLVKGDWVQIAVYDPEQHTMQRWANGRFEAYEPENENLPETATSFDWYRGQRDYLGFASIRKTNGQGQGGNHG